MDFIPSRISSHQKHLKGGSHTTFVSNILAVGEQIVDGKSENRAGCGWLQQSSWQITGVDEDNSQKESEYLWFGSRYLWDDNSVLAKTVELEIKLAGNQTNQTKSNQLNFDIQSDQNFKWLGKPLYFCVFCFVFIFVEGRIIAARFFNED